MSIAETIELWTYKTLNPFVKALLRSPLHGIASKNIALLHFRGRKSGREFVTPLSYVRENGTVCLLSAHGTRWWMNLREEGTPVSLEGIGHSSCILAQRPSMGRRGRETMVSRKGDP
jgi:hypothetical protein